MQKALGVIIVLALLCGGWYWYAHEARPSAPAPMLSADLYPLYPSAAWGAAEATTSPDYGAIVRLDSDPFTNVTNIAAISQPFTAYYHDKLTEAGWLQDMSKEAGGPGAEVSYYTKRDEFAVVSFHSDFLVKHPDAPSECPCNVTFSLINGTETAPLP
jgi:hypothetical protein